MTSPSPKSITVIVSITSRHPYIIIRRRTCKHQTRTTYCQNTFAHIKQRTHFPKPTYMRLYDQFNPIWNTPPRRSSYMFRINSATLPNTNSKKKKKKIDLLKQPSKHTIISLHKINKKRFKTRWTCPLHVVFLPSCVTSVFRHLCFFFKKCQHKGTSSCQPFIRGLDMLTSISIDSI